MRLKKVSYSMARAQLGGEAEFRSPMPFKDNSDN